MVCGGRTVPQWLFIFATMRIEDRSLTPLPCPYAVSSAMMNRASMLHDSRPSRSSPTSQHLRTILALLALLPAGLLNLGCETVSDLSVVWLELLESLWRVVDQSETSCLSTTELRPEA